MTDPKPPAQPVPFAHVRLDVVDAALEWARFVRKEIEESGMATQKASLDLVIEHLTYASKWSPLVYYRGEEVLIDLGAAEVPSQTGATKPPKEWGN